MYDDIVLVTLQEGVGGLNAAIRTIQADIAKGDFSHAADLSALQQRKQMLEKAIANTSASASTPSGGATKEGSAWLASCVAGG